jgi:hypothetical protein
MALSPCVCDSDEEWEVIPHGKSLNIFHWMHRRLRFGVEAQPDNSLCFFERELHATALMAHK